MYIDVKGVTVAPRHGRNEMVLICIVMSYYLKVDNDKLKMHNLQPGITNKKV